ncbi:MAG: hypothetical protein M1833_005669 [Piccolia ochrophora]|nr:MAG: hypothetical protein M1833_005669 [Piccolia ochrophora]
MAREAQRQPFLNGLNSAQREAVTCPSDVLQILAPPGSGKTTTLTSRVAYLLIHNDYEPRNVIVATFTVKAAREMKARLGDLIGQDREAKLVLGTFHSIARRFLVRHGHLIGIHKSFGIADTSDSLAIIKRINKRRKLNIDPGRARSRISSNKSRGISLEKFQSSGKKTLEAQEILTAYEEYEMTLRRSNLLDYDDLLLRCTDLLRQHPSCVSTIEAVLVDEFQDTNLVQFELTTLLAAHKRRVTW